MTATTKTSGLGDNFYIGGYDLSGDIGSVDMISSPLAPLDVTAIKKTANERIGGIRAGDIQFTSFFEYGGIGNPTFEHDVLSMLPRTDTVATYFRGTTQLNPSACCIGKQINYDGTRDNSGGLTMKTEVQSNGYGLEWGKMLTAGLRTDTTGTISASIDDYGSAGLSYGGQAYFQVLSVTGTSVTIDIQSCATSGVSYITTGLTSSAVTHAVAPTSQRVAVANTTAIARYLKVVTTGTFTNAVFAVMFVRNLSAGIVF